MEKDATNPFTPVVGKVPLHIAGREEIIADIETALDGTGNDPAVISLLVGPRGTGKTALLSYFADAAETSGWVTARVTCVEGMLDDVLVRAQRSARHLVDTRPPRKIKGASLGGLISLELEDSPREPANWRSRMEDIVDALAEHDAGLLVTIDEVDPNVDEMVILVAAFQHLLDEGRRVALIMAGLPYGISSLLSGRSTSFLRRAARYELRALYDYEVQESLIRTMSDGGKAFDDKALEVAVEAVRGFPFMLQLVGYRTWRMAGDSDIVSRSNVEAAARVARMELEQRVYEAVWFELSEADKSFLLAMAEDPVATRQADLSSRLDKSSGHVSRYKRRLLQQGVIQERSRCLLEFCLPGFKEYFAERIAEERGL